MVSSRPLKRLAPVAILVSVVACAAGPPSSSDARSVLQRRLDGGNESRLRLTTFEKTDGKSMEVMGVKVYELMFTATAEFTDDAMFKVGGGSTLFGTSIDGRASEITTSEYRSRSGNFMQDFGLDFNNLRPARKADTLDLTGQIAFEQRESGWVATNTTFTLEHRKSIVGRWYDGGPTCAEATPRGADAILLKVWKCSVGIENAGELTLRKTTDGYLDSDSKATARLTTGDVMIVELQKDLYDKPGHSAVGGQISFRRE